MNHPSQPPTGSPNPLPSPYYPAPAPKSGSGATIAIVVGAVVLVIVAIIGVLAVLAISGVRKYLTAAKSAEARFNVGTISKESQAAYEARTPRELCPSATSPIPRSVSSIAGKKYIGGTSDWEMDAPTHAGFSCLKFSMLSPQYYQYDYKASGTRRAPGDEFTVTAHGDLNGDGVLSTFQMTGRIAASGDLVVAPTILETNPDE